MISYSGDKFFVVLPGDREKSGGQCAAKVLLLSEVRFIGSIESREDLVCSK